MRLSRPSPSIGDQYRSFWAERDLACPGYPRHGVWVVRDEPDGKVTLLMGVAVLLTQDGAFALIEGFATNPNVSLTERHEATSFGLKSLLDLSAMLDRTLIMTPSRKSKGVQRVARKLGFQVGDTLPIFGGMRQ